MKKEATIEVSTRWLAHSPMGPRYFDSLADARAVFPRCQINESQAVFMALNGTLNGTPKALPLSDVRTLLALEGVRVFLSGSPFELIEGYTVASAFGLNSKQAAACRELGHKVGGIVLNREQAIALLEPSELAALGYVAPPYKRTANGD